MYTEISRRCIIKGSRKNYALKLNKNLYGSGRVWYKYLKAGLRKAGFKQSKTDECVDFAGGFMKGHTDDPNTAKPRSSYNVMYNNCLFYWNTKIQTEITLSTTEVEYICLSQSPRTTKKDS